MPVENARRRKFLQGVGTVATFSLAGCVGSITGSSESELQKQLDSVEEATAQYEDPKTALEDGFQIGGPYVPGMGWHFTNPEWLQDAAENGLNIEKPPMLTYVEGDDGLQLASLEYGLPSQAVEETPDLFADESSDEATEEWHSHDAATHVFAKSDGEQNDPKNVAFEDWVTNDYWTEFQPPSQDLEAGDEVALNWGTANGKEGDKEERVVDLVTQHPSLTTLHAWVHIENPEGVFKPINPDYA